MFAKKKLIKQTKKKQKVFSGKKVSKVTYQAITSQWRGGHCLQYDSVQQCHLLNFFFCGDQLKSEYEISTFFL